MSAARDDDVEHRSGRMRAESGRVAEPPGEVQQVGERVRPAVTQEDRDRRFGAGRRAICRAEVHEVGGRSLDVDPELWRAVDLPLDGAPVEGISPEREEVLEEHQIGVRLIRSRRSARVASGTSTTKGSGSKRVSTRDGHSGASLIAAGPRVVAVVLPFRRTRRPDPDEGRVVYLRPPNECVPQDRLGRGALPRRPGR